MRYEARGRYSGPNIVAYATAPAAAGFFDDDPLVYKPLNIVEAVNDALDRLVAFLRSLPEYADMLVGP